MSPPEPDEDRLANLALRRDAPVKCASCGRSTARRARQQRYCSARCKENARRRVRRPRTGVSSFPAVLTAVRPNLPTDPPKIVNEIKGLQVPIRASTGVINAEVWGGRDWRPARSSGGVRIEVSRLRARTLVERAT